MGSFDEDKTVQPTPNRALDGVLLKHSADIDQRTIRSGDDDGIGPSLDMTERDHLPVVAFLRPGVTDGTLGQLPTSWIPSHTSTTSLRGRHVAKF